MANHKSSEKRIRQTARRTIANRDRLSRIRTHVRAVETAITSGDKNAAQDALKRVQPQIMKGVTKGIFKPNTAARKMSRLSARVKALTP